jgi:Helix-turn-helix domain
MITIIMAIEILTPDEVGELLRLPPNRVMLLARRGEILFLTIDGRLRFDARDIEDWVRSQRSDSPAMPPRVINTAG